MNIVRKTVMVAALLVIGWFCGMQSAQAESTSWSGFERVVLQARLPSTTSHKFTGVKLDFAATGRLLSYLFDLPPQTRADVLPAEQLALSTQLLRRQGWSAGFSVKEATSAEPDTTHNSVSVPCGSRGLVNCTARVEIVSVFAAERSDTDAVRIDAKHNSIQFNLILSNKSYTKIAQNGQTDGVLEMTIDPIVLQKMHTQVQRPGAAPSLALLKALYLSLYTTDQNAVTKQ